jgi:gamma-glutamyl:cysteine ligase YbdK (ATP-grasp superfamily)
MSGVSYMKGPERTPNKFFYACPEGMIKKEELPPYAGLIYVPEDGGARIVKAAAFIHKEKHVKHYLSTLTDKFYWQFLNMRTEFKWIQEQHKEFQEIRDKNYTLTEAIDIEKNGGFIEKLAKLEKQLEESHREGYKLRSRITTQNIRIKTLENKLNTKGV